MKISVKLLLLIALIFCAAPLANARAEDTTKFFSSLEDVPLAPGLTELPEQTVAFDQPEGRIVESVALVESGDDRSISSFYDATLPQLGWSRRGKLSFARENERLTMNFESEQGRKFLRLSVAPEGVSAH